MRAKRIKLHSRLRYKIEVDRNGLHKKESGHTRHDDGYRSNPLSWPFNRHRDFGDKPRQIKKRAQYKEKQENGESCIHTVKSEKQIEYGAGIKDYR